MTRRRLAAAALAAAAALNISTPAAACRPRPAPVCATVTARWDGGLLRTVVVSTARDPEVMPVVTVQVLDAEHGTVWIRTVRGESTVRVRPGVDAAALVVTSGAAVPATCRAWVDAPTDQTPTRTVTRVRAAR